MDVWKQFISELLQVAVHRPHGISSCVASLSRSPSLETNTVYNFTQAVGHVLLDLFRRCSTMKILVSDWAVFIVFILFDLHHTMVHHLLKDAQRLAASPTSKDIWGLVTELLDSATGMTQSVCGMTTGDSPVRLLGSQ